MLRIGSTCCIGNLSAGSSWRSAPHKRRSGIPLCSGCLREPDWHGMIQWALFVTRWSVLRHPRIKSPGVRTRREGTGLGLTYFAKEAPAGLYTNYI